jgi:hypothetical protein
MGYKRKLLWVGIGVAGGAALAARARRREAAQPARAAITIAAAEEAIRAAWGDPAVGAPAGIELRCMAAPGEGATEVRVESAAGGTRARWQMQSALRRLKQLVETGEIATIAGQPSGQRSRWVSAIEPFDKAA